VVDLDIIPIRGREEADGVVNARTASLGRFFMVMVLESKSNVMVKTVHFNFQFECCAACICIFVAWNE
jgi:hypothetical protein